MKIILKRIAIAVAILLAFSVSAGPLGAVVGWAPVNDPTVGYYRVYWRTNQPTAAMNSGLVGVGTNTMTITNGPFVSGGTYQFYVTAITVRGTEGDLSEPAYLTFDQKPLQVRGVGVFQITTTTIVLTNVSSGGL